MSNTPLLEVTDLHGGYGSGPVLHGIELEIFKGSVTALLGRNGMGKSSTIRAVAGLLPESSGTIRLFGRDLMGLPSHHRARLGIGLVPEGRQVFGSLTVREHLTVAARPPREGTGWTLERLMELFPVLGRRAKALGTHLSGGEQQLLAIARALSLNPALLLFDEPTEGLAPSIVQEIGALIRRIREEQDAPAILLVEQNLPFALSVADQVVVLVHGEIAHRGPAADLKQRRDLQQSLIGVGAA